jgi:Uri superfamily endonuclease
MPEQDASAAPTIRAIQRPGRDTVIEPPWESWPDAGVYQLWIRATTDLHVTVGRLGRFLFPRGVYVYTGRASRGLRARVLRHVAGATRKHWHIDFLLAGRCVRVERVVLASSDPAAECSVNQSVGAAATRVAPGFGASDCRRSCTTHLWHLPRERPRAE